MSYIAATNPPRLPYPFAPPLPTCPVPVLCALPGHPATAVASADGLTQGGAPRGGGAEQGAAAGARRRSPTMDPGASLRQPCCRSAGQLEARVDGDHAKREVLIVHPFEARLLNHLCRTGWRVQEGLGQWNAGPQRVPSRRQAGRGTQGSQAGAEVRTPAQVSWSGNMRMDSTRYWYEAASPATTLSEGGAGSAASLVMQGAGAAGMRQPSEQHAVRSRR